MANLKRSSKNRITKLLKRFEVDSIKLVLYPTAYNLVIDISLCTKGGRSRVNTPLRVRDVAAEKAFEVFDNDCVQLRSRTNSGTAASDSSNLRNGTARLKKTPLVWPRNDAP